MTTRLSHHRARFLALTVMAAPLLSGAARAQHFEYKEHHLGPTGLWDAMVKQIEPATAAPTKVITLEEAKHHGRKRMTMTIELEKNHVGRQAMRGPRIRRVRTW